MFLEEEGSPGGIYITFDIRCQCLSVVFGEDGNTNVGRMFPPAKPYDSYPSLRPIRLSYPEVMEGYLYQLGRVVKTGLLLGVSVI